LLGPFASKAYPLRSTARRTGLVLRSVDLAGGLSSPLLCAPARRPAHLLGCSASHRLAACPAACVGEPLDSLSLCAPAACTSGAGVPTRGTSHWGHPLRVERLLVSRPGVRSPQAGAGLGAGPDRLHDIPGGWWHDIPMAFRPLGLWVCAVTSPATRRFSLLRIRTRLNT
jgi:hypothetical protein